MCYMPRVYLFIFISAKTCKYNSDKHVQSTHNHIKISYGETVKGDFLKT